MGFWEDLSNLFKKSVTVVAQKTDEYTKIGKIKVDIISIKREIDKKHTDLGRIVYQLIAIDNTTKISTNDQVKTTVEKLKELNSKLNQKKEELETVRREYAQKTGKPLDEEPVGESADEAQG